MPLIYLDPENGNDANDGLTFATRKKTFKEATTAANWNGEVRVIASPDPVNIGDAQWTDNSKEITWSNPRNLVLDNCNAGWTGVTNATVTHSTGSRMTGTACLQVAVATAFTTGKIAYKTLPSPKDFTAFQQIAFWFMVSSVSVTSLNLKIALCSDTAGDVIVDSVDVLMTLADLTASQWEAFVVDKGSFFTADNVNSIAIYLNADPSTSAARTLSFDNLVACKPPGDPNMIDLFTLIGKKTVGEPEWYNVWEISENGVVIGASLPSSLTTDPPRPYRGTTELVATYALNPLRPKAPDADRVVNLRIDIEVNPIEAKITGGWDRTAMATQSGETWITSEYDACGLQNEQFGGVQSGWLLEKIGLCHCTFGFRYLNIQPLESKGAVDAYTRLKLLGLVACYTPLQVNSVTFDGYSEVDVGQVWGHNAPLTTAFGNGKLEASRVHGFTDTASSVGALRLVSGSQFREAQARIGKIDNNVCGLVVEQGSRTRLIGTEFANNTQVAVPETTTRSARQTELTLERCSGLDSTALNNLCITLDYGAGRLNLVEWDNNPDDHRCVAYGTTCLASKTDVRRGASGYAWQLRRGVSAPTGLIYASNRRAATPMPLATFPVEAGKEVTVSCYIYLGVIPTYGTFGISVPADMSLEIPFTYAEADRAIVGSWQKVTLTFTPVRRGLVTVGAYGWGAGFGGGDSWANFDDLEIGQEA